MTEEDALSTRNRATGPYAWAYWMMLLRPVFIGLTTQLFWINKLSKKGVLRGLIILIIFLALLMTGANLERYIIAITSIHRDYPNIEWQLNDTWLMLIPLILFIVFERIFIFTFLILILWFLNKQNKKQLLYNLVNLKHFILFWITALLILIVGIPPTFESNALDINIHDTYYVIAGLQVTFVIAIIYAFIGLVYWITYKMELSLNNTLTKIHIIISIGLFFIYQIGILLLTRDEFPLFDMYTSLNTLTTTVLISVIVAQSFFIVNLFISFYKHGIQRTTSR